MAAIFTALYLKMLTWDFAGLFFGDYLDQNGNTDAKIGLLSKSLTPVVIMTGLITYFLVTIHDFSS